MKDLCGRFHFAKDMNGDFVFTISDVWLMIKFVWLLPVKAVLALIETDSKWMTFFEVDCSTGESWGGGILAFFGWIAILVLIVSLLVEFGNRAGGSNS
jgi:hypothetical protein